MKIYSGCDIVRISRMEGFTDKGGLKRCFTENEEKYIMEKAKPFDTAAGLFAAKEALGKALGKGLSSFNLKDVEVCHEEDGRPYFSFKDGLFDGLDISLSISHDGDYALAFVVIKEL